MLGFFLGKSNFLGALRFFHISSGRINGNVSHADLIENKEVSISNSRERCREQQGRLSIFLSIFAGEHRVNQLTSRYGAIFADVSIHRWLVLNVLTCVDSFWACRSYTGYLKQYHLVLVCARSLQLPSYMGGVNGWNTYILHTWTQTNHVTWERRSSIKLIQSTARLHTE